MNKIKPNSKYDSHIVTMGQSPKYNILLQTHHFNYGGKKIQPIGSYNHDNIKSYIEVKKYMVEHGKKFRIALDVGARWGEWTRLMQNDFWHIYCFEPVMKKYKIINENCDVTKFTLYGSGLGNKEENVYMYGGCIYDPSLKDINSKTPIPQQKTIQRTILLDSLEIPKVDFIKMDIEGYEYLALLGGTNTILKWKPVICIEQNKSDLKWRGVTEENQAINYLISLGMRIAKKLNKQDYLMVWDNEIIIQPSITQPTEDTQPTENTQPTEDVENTV
jgi:FkbM family methyltransferase